MSDSESATRDIHREFISDVYLLLSRRQQAVRIIGGEEEFNACTLSQDLLHHLLKRQNEADEVRCIRESGHGLRDENPLVFDGGRFLLTTRSGAPLTPRKFQIRDIKKMLSLTNSANFSVPGAGKTLVTLLVYENEKLCGRVNQLMVVAPLSAFESWTNEIANCFSPEPMVRQVSDPDYAEAEILLVNYQKLSPNFDVIASWLSKGESHLVLDEAHRMKRGLGGEWGSMCLRLADFAQRRDVLTGTPAPHHPRDFIAIFDFLWPQQAFTILPNSIENDRVDDLLLNELSQEIEPFFVRTTKDELGLLPPIEHRPTVLLSPLHSEIYQAINSRLRNYMTASNAQRIRVSEIARVTTYLLQAATNPALLAKPINQSDESVEAAISWPPLALDPGTDLFDKIVNYLSYEVPRKFELIASIVNQNTLLGKKTLIWSTFIANIKVLELQVLTKYNPVAVYGEIKNMRNEKDLKSRQYALNKFREDPNCKVLIANPATLGEGISLHNVCHDAIYLERTFNAGEYLQSVDRIHRLGLADEIETNLTFLKSQGTIDEIVETRLKMKVTNLGLMLDDKYLTRLSLPDDDTPQGSWELDEEDRIALLDSLFSVQD